MRVAEAIEIDAHTERELRTLSKGRRVEARVQQRANIVLLAAQGWQNKDIADEVKLDRRQVALWRKRFLEGGIAALLQDAPRWGRPPSVTSAVESFILNTTLHEQPSEAASWSSRGLASYLGLSATTVRRVWQRNGLKPHAQDIFKVTSDPPHFADKCVDVVGMYVGPREHALVLGCDEKGMSRAPRRASARDEERPRPAALLVGLKALDLAAAAVPADPLRHEKWIDFLRLVERQAPRHLQLHLIVEGKTTHGHREVQAWLTRHPRMVLHLPSADEAWSKRLRRVFRDLGAHGIRRDSYAGLPGLLDAMARYVAHRPQRRKPFVWTTGL